MSTQAFPALDAATEAALRASIERFGILIPVVHDQDGNTLDGHHRERIADELGFVCDVRIIPVNDKEHAREIARTLNEDRRHLMDIEQRRAVVADLHATGEHSTRAIAGAVGVDHSTVVRDLQKSTGADAPVPERVTGLDGKSRPAKRKPPTSSRDDGPAHHLPDLLPGASPSGELREMVVAWCHRERAIAELLDGGVKPEPIDEEDQQSLLESLMRIGKTATRLRRLLT